MLAISIASASRPVDGDRLALEIDGSDVRARQDRNRVAIDRDVDRSLDGPFGTERANAPWLDTRPEVLAAWRDEVGDGMGASRQSEQRDDCE